MNPNRWIINETKRWTSLLKNLRKEGKINEQFEIMLHNLTLEEVIAAKLELSSRTLNSPLYGLPIWQHLPEIVQDAVLKFAISTTQTTSECARFLGISQAKLYLLVKKYKIFHYFDMKYLKNKEESDSISSEEKNVSD